MERRYLTLLLIGGMITMFGCGGSQDGGSEEGGDQDTTTVSKDTAGTSKAAKDESSASMKKEGIKLTPFKDSPEFADAKLTLSKPAKNAEVAAGKVGFSYEVTNYELGAKTKGYEKKGIAYSKNGQHIHQIVNNKPYTAHYEPEFKKEFKKGHYVVLSFLARNWHESVKNPNAYDVRQFTVGTPSKVQKVDLTKPHMFYSRPKGTYTGDDTKKVLLDFYLLNADLAPDGKKVKATINGTTFTIDKWQPYLVEGLPMGENTIKLKFVDKNGKAIDSPYNPVTRTVSLEKAM